MLTVWLNCKPAVCNYGYISVWHYSKRFRLRCFSKPEVRPNFLVGVRSISFSYIRWMASSTWSGSFSMSASNWSRANRIISEILTFTLRSSCHRFTMSYIAVSCLSRKGIVVLRQYGSESEATGVGARGADVGGSLTRPISSIAFATSLMLGRLRIGVDTL